MFEIDSVRDMFTGSEKLQNISEEVLEEESGTTPVLSDEPKYKAVDENKMLEILNRMNRVVMILISIKIKLIRASQKRSASSILE